MHHRGAATSYTVTIYLYRTGPDGRIVRAAAGATVRPCYPGRFITARGHGGKTRRGTVPGNAFSGRRRASQP